MLRTGDTIEYLVDVSSPLNQKGIRGQTKVIDRHIPLWTARYLFRGGKVRLYNPASPLQLEEEKTKDGPDGPAEIPGPDKKISTGKKERRTEANGQRKSNSKTNQDGDDGPEKSDSKRRVRSRRD